MKKIAMIMSVGTGTRPETDMAAPLLKSIRHTRPNLLYLLITEGSRSTAQSIATRLQEAGEMDASDIVPTLLPDADNIQSIYTHVLEVFRAIEQQRNIPTSDVVVDYTSGTKPMSAGLALAGVEAGCRVLQYMTGTRVGGVVQSGTEQPLSIYPSTISAHASLKLAGHLLHEFRFDAAIQVVDSVESALLDEATKKDRKTLHHLASAYRSWDLFQYERFKTDYNEIGTLSHALQDCRVEASVPNRLGKLAGERSALPDDLLADVLNNATRRLNEGKYDDATARLYRLVEMIAQRTLKNNYGIESGNVDLGKAPAEQQADLERLRDPRDGQIKIGLARSYGLLAALGHPVGSLYNHEIGTVLQARNDSLLAHGVKPVTEKDCRSLHRRVAELLRTISPDLASRCFELRFPWTKTSYWHPD